MSDQGKLDLIVLLIAWQIIQESLHTFLKVHSLFKGEMFIWNYISFAGYSLKHHDTVEYLGCQLDSKLSGEALASKVLRKINAKLKSLYRQSICLIPAFRRLLCNTLIQAHFDCKCSSWFPLLKKNIKIKLQKAQKVLLPRRCCFHPLHFRKIKLRPATGRVEHCIVNTVFKY